MKFTPLALSLLLAAIPIAASAQTKILFNSFGPATTAGDMLLKWADDIGTASNGSINMIIPPSSLAPPPEQVNLVTQGVVDGAYIMNAFLEKSNPLIQLSMLPMAGGKGEVHALALWNTYNKFFKDSGEFENIHLLGFFAQPSGMIASVGPSLESSTDLKGKRVFTLPGNPAQAADLLGAVVVVGPAVRSYELISKGTVDYYAGLNFGNAVDFNQVQFTKSVKTVPGGIFSPAFSLFFSKEKWESLTPEEQNIPQFSGEYIAKMSKAFDEVEDAAIAKFEAEGIPISALSDADVAELEKAWAPMRQKWVEAANANGVDGQAALDFYSNEIKRLSAESQ